MLLETPLDFVGNKPWDIYAHQDVRIELDARRTRDGTFPPGSQWTKNLLKPSPPKQPGHVIDTVPATLQQG